MNPNIIYVLFATIYLEWSSEPLYIAVAACETVDQATKIAQSFHASELRWQLDADPRDPLDNPVWDADADALVSMSYGLILGKIASFSVTKLTLNELMAFDWKPVLAVTHDRAT